MIPRRLWILPLAAVIAVLGFLLTEKVYAQETCPCTDCSASPCQVDDDDGIALLPNPCQLTWHDSIWHDADDIFGGCIHCFCRETVQVGCDMSTDCLGRCGPGCGMISGTGAGVYSVDCAEHDRCCRLHGDCLNPYDPECGDEWHDAVDDTLFGTPNCQGCVPLDLIFVIDTTGSMWDDIAQVKVSAAEIVNSIDSSPFDYRIALVDYRDFPIYPYGGSGDYPYNARLAFSSDKPAIISAIQGLSLGWGADWRESVYSGLIRSINTEGLGAWRDNVKKVIILMGDAPPHDPEPFTGYTLSSVVAAAEAVDPASIYPIVIGGDSITYAYFASLAEETAGKVFTALTATDVVEALLSAIEIVLETPIAEAGGPYSGNIGEPITFDGSASFDPDGEIVSYEWDFDNDGTYDLMVTTPTTTYTYGAEYSGLVKLRVTDNDALIAVDTAGVEILGNQPPVAHAGPDQTVPAGPDCMASVTLDGSGSSDPDGDLLTYSWTWTVDATPQSTTGVNPTIQLPLGITTITLVVNDGTVDSDPDTVDITTVDNTPPEISLSVSPDTLWPPNHKMVLIAPTITATDNCDSNLTIALESITTNEGEETNTYDPNYDSTLGDGHTVDDIQVDADGIIDLRAERSGTGSGRIYTIVYSATDASGNIAEASATVTVPHN